MARSKLTASQELAVIREAVKRGGEYEPMDGDNIRVILADALGISMQELDEDYFEYMMRLADYAEIHVVIPRWAVSQVRRDHRRQ